MKRMINVLLVATLACLLWGVASETEDSDSNSNLRVTQIAGLQLFHLKSCNDCHTLGEKADGELTRVANKGEDAWFGTHVETETKIVLQEAKGRRRIARVLKKEVAALNDFLFESSAEEKKQVAGLAENVSEGAYLAYQNNCLNCHAIAGVGKDAAPELTHVADEHGDKTWLIKNLQNPQQFAPESMMPKFGEKLSDVQLGKIADYLLTLKSVALPSAATKM